ncbi:hypothetical protein E4U42_001861 [Claviceps africana]|uniref:CHRD domain-containing protein n=1 Tax=Claviceps africana TaxID=83212 RepID=A0A8K0NJN4_9HYPO|nr:hypothetical protein E4U42_001861 [Claviceps africana]
MKASFIFFGYTAAVAASPLVNLKDLLAKPSTNSPFTFTSTFSVLVEPKAVVDNNNKPTGGLEGASGVFNFGINSLENVICYNLTLNGFRGTFQSPARTATHIHQAAVNKSGPPRIAFPNPEGPEHGPRTSVGCLRGPFVTGIKASDGSEKDTGEGFDVGQIEEDPSQFFTDVHSSLASAGAVRGQLDSRSSC